MTETTREALAAELTRLADRIDPPQFLVTPDTRALAAEVMRAASAALADVPAPPAVPPAVREAIVSCLTAELGDAYDCTRVWEAWSVGTMTESDFKPLSERVDEIADGLLEVLAHVERAPADALGAGLHPVMQDALRGFLAPAATPAAVQPDADCGAAQFVEDMADAQGREPDGFISEGGRYFENCHVAQDSWLRTDENCFPVWRAPPAQPLPPAGSHTVDGLMHLIYDRRPLAVAFYNFALDHVGADRDAARAALLAADREISTYAEALAATRPAGSTAEPVAWQWRKKGEPWTLEKTFNSEVFATTPDSEVRALYTSQPLSAAPQGEDAHGVRACSFARMGYSCACAICAPDAGVRGTPASQMERVPCARCTSDIYCEMNGCQRLAADGVKGPEHG